MKFTEKTIKRLAEIGIKPSGLPTQFCNKDCNVWVYESTKGDESEACVSISIYRYPSHPFLCGKSLRQVTEKALALAEQAEKIIKENGK